MRVDRGDRKRPDGMNMIPWSRGESLVWDVMLVNSVGEIYLLLTSREACAAAGAAKDRKKLRYESLVKRFIFKSLGFEIFGSWGSKASDLVRLIGQRIS